MLRLVAVLALFALTAPGSPGDHPPAGKGMGLSVCTPTQFKWTDGPPSIPPGAKMAILEGDPTKEGPFVMRLKVPDGYRIAPHTHPKPERVTVLSGTFHIGMGDRFDAAKGDAMPAGSYGTWAAGMKHYAWVTGETVIQLHGNGPWQIKYLNPADDPRNHKK
ncbi:MAG TPA: cupin domain-containing protein [Fimbriiglobus sp.]|nr:cupin domain-containing protein [Fimbriiglobus sp.]